MAYSGVHYHGLSALSSDDFHTVILMRASRNMRFDRSVIHSIILNGIA